MMKIAKQYAKLGGLTYPTFTWPGTRNRQGGSYWNKDGFAKSRFTGQTKAVVRSAQLLGQMYLLPH